MTNEDADDAMERATQRLLEAGWAVASASSGGKQAIAFTEDGAHKLRTLAALLVELGEHGRVDRLLLIAMEARAKALPAE